MNELLQKYEELLNYLYSNGLKDRLNILNTREKYTNILQKTVLPKEIINIITNYMLFEESNYYIGFMYEGVYFLYIIKNYIHEKIEWVDILIQNNLANKQVHLINKFIKIDIDLFFVAEQIAELFISEGELSMYYDEVSSYFIIEFVNNTQGIKIHFINNYGSPFPDDFDIL